MGRDLDAIMQNAVADDVIREVGELLEQYLEKRAKKENKEFHVRYKQGLLDVAAMNVATEVAFRECYLEVWPLVEKKIKSKYGLN